MFKLFSKKKYFLKDYISEQFTDIHSHIIPGIDDGAKNIEQSKKLLHRIQNNLGIKNMIPTPHTMHMVWDNTSENINKTFEELRDEIKSEASIEINLKQAASEYFLDDHFIALLEKNDILAIQGKYVLIELAFGTAPLNLFDMLFKIQVAGYKPILAHPERYYYLHDTIEEFQKIKDTGCLLQLNLLSLTSYYGKDVQKVAEKLLKLDLIDLVGSDIHHERHLDFLESKFLTDSMLEKLIPALKNNEVLFN